MDPIKLDIIKRKTMIIDKLIWLKLRRLEKTRDEDIYRSIENDIISSLDLFETVTS